MSTDVKVLLPNIGDFSDVEIIEIHVAQGQSVDIEQSLLTLESDKATMDVPSTVAGQVVDLAIQIGDKISEGDVLMTVRTNEKSESVTKDVETDQSDPGSDNEDKTSTDLQDEPDTNTTAPDSSPAQPMDVLLPDIGDFSDVEVIELHVSIGDTVEIESPLLTLESDKATMDVPSPVAGVVSEITVKIGDKISQGDMLAKVTSGEAQTTEHPAAKPQKPAPKAPSKEAKKHSDIPDADTRAFNVPSPPPTLPPPVERSKDTLPHASPGVRRFARELGADLSQIRGTAAKGRIVREDVKKYVKKALEENVSQDAMQRFGPPPLPEIDFSKFGEIQNVKLSKIKRITGDRLHRSWLDIPHVTHHDEADITELDAFRKAIDTEQKAHGNRVTILAFICKAIINALQQFPNFNASLSLDGQSLILKKYFHIGVAVDTPNGLVVPVIRDMQNLGVLEIAKTLQKTGLKARDGELTPSDFQGGCFTISSLGGIGGRFFTPIINPPEVAILGVSRNHPVAVPNGNTVAWKTMLPLSLSYDHRVIDGAEAARFTKFVCELLYDSRRIIL